MGIPSYFSYIVKNHPEIIRKLCNNTMKINNLYLYVPHSIKSENIAVNHLSLKHYLRRVFP